MHGEEGIWVLAERSGVILLEETQLLGQPWVHISPLSLSGCLMLAELLNLLMDFPSETRSETLYISLNIVGRVNWDRRCEKYFVKCKFVYVVNYPKRFVVRPSFIGSFI